jgi:hypothetical protein
MRSHRGPTTDDVVQIVRREMQSGPPTADPAPSVRPSEDTNARIEELRSQVTELQRLIGRAADVQPLVSALGPVPAPRSTREPTAAPDSDGAILGTLTRHVISLRDSVFRALRQAGESTTRLAEAVTHIERLGNSQASTSTEIEQLRARAAASDKSVESSLNVLAGELADLRQRVRGIEASIPATPLVDDETVAAPDGLSEAEPLVAVLGHWLRRLPPSRPTPEMPDSDAYLASLRRCVNILRRDARSTHRDVEHRR